MEAGGELEIPDEQEWGRLPRIVRVLLCLPLLGLVGWMCVPGDGWPVVEQLPMLLFLGVMTVLWQRGVGVRTTKDELVLRRVFGTTRIPRADVVSAEFGWRGLHIRLRDGRKAFSRLAPKMTSTELSGDPPAPDSAAYQITRWAQSAEQP
jgi:hypothetical protein